MSCLRRVDASRLEFGGPPTEGWQRGINHVLAFAALLALVLAPLNLCCLGRSPAASSVTSLESSLGHTAHVVLCAHGGADREDHAPDHGRHSACPCCHLVNTATLDPSPTITVAVYPNSRAGPPTGPEILGAPTRPAALAGRPRAPPYLI